MFSKTPPKGWPKDRPWPPVSKRDLTLWDMFSRDSERFGRGVAKFATDVAVELPKAIPGMAKELGKYAMEHPVRAGVEMTPAGWGSVAGNIIKEARHGRADIPGLAMAAIAGITHTKLKGLPKFRAAAIELADGSIHEGRMHFDAVESAIAGRKFTSGKQRVRAIDKLMEGAKVGFTDETGAFLDRSASAERLNKMGFKAFGEGGGVSTEEIPKKAWASGAPGDGNRSRFGDYTKIAGDSVAARGVRSARGPNPDILKLTESLRPKDAMNLPRITAIDPKRGRQMAVAYEKLPVNDEAARDAYNTLNEEVERQYKTITDAGYKLEFVDADPYKNSAEMMADVRDNKRLRVFKTADDQAHPYMTPEQNNKFRAVHDFIAHAGEGHQFGPVGEENAYRVHASTLSPTAQRALATETRGQNSWVNYGPHGEKPVAERPFAQQKAALWPEELLGDYDKMPEHKPVNITMEPERTVDAPARMKTPWDSALKRIGALDSIITKAKPRQKQRAALPEWVRVEDSDDRLALYDTRKPNQPLVGYVLTTPDGEDGLKARAAFVSEKYRRQGLATAMYDHIEQTRGKPMRPSSEQSVDSRAFWESRKSRGTGKQPAVAADTLFHGTYRNFDRFREPDKDIGVHLGTPAQAHARLLSLADTWTPDHGGEHPQLLRVVTPHKKGIVQPHDSKVVQLPDLGQWKVPDLQRELTRAFDNGWETQNLHTHAEIRDWLKKEWDKHAVTYKNDFEAADGVTHSLAVMNPDEAKIIASLDMRADAQDRRYMRAGQLRAKGAGPKDIAAEMENEWRPRGDSIVVKAATPKPANVPEQRDLPRMLPKRKSQSLLDDVEERTLRAYMGPKFEKWAAEGNHGDWYDTFGTEQAARDALGDEEGPAAFKRLMQFMGATTARSTPANNLRRAGYYRGLENAGLLDVEALFNKGYKKVPEGMGHIANNAQHNALASLLEGGLDPIKNPKPASFTENLSRNQRPFTNDTRMATGLRHVDPTLEKMGAFTKSTNPYGGVTFSPRDWAYGPMERAGQRAASEYAGRGMLNVRPGLDPTAHFQAKVWDALGGEIPGASRSSGQFDDVFKSKLDANAKAWGVTPAEANRLFWQGHPFDLPLNKDVVPRGLLSSFGR